MTLQELNALQIRGAFTIEGEFVGYDYRLQQWIDTRNHPGDRIESAPVGSANNPRRTIQA